MTRTRASVTPSAMIVDITHLRSTVRSLELEGSSDARGVPPTRTPRRTQLLHMSSLRFPYVILSAAKDLPSLPGPGWVGRSFAALRMTYTRALRPRHTDRIRG